MLHFREAVINIRIGSDSAVTAANPLALRVFLFAVAAVWVAGLLFPLFASESTVFLFPFIKNIFGIVCHQESAKCIELGNMSLLVCARCTGIYFGTFAVFAAFLFKPILTDKTGLLFFLLSLAPMALDVFAGVTGIYAYQKSIALFSGFICGAGVVIFAYPKILPAG